MNILVVGGGGREHAIIRSLKKNPQVETIYALPGNGGIAGDATCVPIGATDLDGIVKFASDGDRHSLLRSQCQRRHYRRQQGIFQEPDEEIRHPHRRL